MPESKMIEELIACLIQVVGRAAMPEENVRGIVGTRPKQIQAFNLADGTRTQAEIVKKTRLDQGSLSVTFKRWVENGVAFWVGSGQDARLLHIYPIPSAGTAKPKGAARLRTGGKPR